MSHPARNSRPTTDQLGALRAVLSRSAPSLRDAVTVETHEATASPVRQAAITALSDLLEMRDGQMRLKVSADEAVATVAQVLAELQAARSA